MPKKTYTDAEKAAYYKKKAAAGTGKKAAPRKRRAAPAGSITGTGKYYKSPYKANKSIGQQIGSAIGGGIGMGAEQLVRWITGLGDYTVKHNVLLAGSPPPMYNNNNHGGVIIRHREFLTDVITHGTPNTFDLKSYSLNPANQYCFPFLSQVAANYEQYVFEGVIFEFRSMSADALNSTNTSLGTVVMATNYNAGAPLFAQKAEMENYEYGVSCKPSVDMLHPIECSPRQTSISELFTRPGDVPTGQDIRLYDWGTFQIATSGFQGASVNIGELWVTYQVALLKPKMYTTLGNFNEIFKARNNNYANGVPLGTPSTLVVNVDTIGISNFSTFGFDIISNSIKQSYYLEITWSAQTAAVLVAPTFNFGFATVKNYQIAESIPADGTTSTSVTARVGFITDGSGNSVTILLNPGTLPTVAPQSVVIRMMQIANDYVDTA